VLKLLRADACGDSGDGILGGLHLKRLIVRGEENGSCRSKNSGV